MLGPEVGDQPEIYKLVKSFEAGLNEKLRKAETERAASAAKQDGGAHRSDLRIESCVRCHGSEGEHRTVGARARGTRCARARTHVARSAL